MDIEAARRAGYSDTEIALELGRRTGRNAQGALDAGHSPLDVIANFEKSLVPSWSEVPGKAAENFFPSAARAVGDVANAFAHPIDTVTALGKTTLGGLQKVTDMLPDGLRNAMATSPGPIGSTMKLATLAPNEWQTREHADAFGEYVSNRYGDMDGFKKAVAYDPVGVLSDFSALMTGGAGAMRGAAKAGSMAGKAGQVMGVAAKVADPMTIPAMAAKKVGGGLSRFLTTPEGMYQSALKPSPKLSDMDRQSVIQTALKERIAPTRAGNDKLRRLMRELGTEVGDLIDYQTRLEKTGASPIDINPNEIALKALSDVEPVLEHSTDAALALRGAGKTTERWLDTRPNMLTTRDAQQDKLRAQYEGQKDFSKTQTTPAQDTRMAISRALRLALEEKIPAIAEPNRRLHGLHNLGEQLSPAIGRAGNWDLFGLPAGLGGGGGMGYALGGPVGAAVGAAASELGRLPGTKARIAFGLDSARNAANSDIAQLVQKTFSGAVGRPARAGAYTGARTDETFQEMMNRYGIKTSLDK